MKNYLTYSFAVILLLLVLFYWWVDESSLSSTSHTKAVPSQLALSLNSCQAIAAKSVAHLNAFLEFQKLEIEGRKMHVFQMCMNDRGYMENPIWTKFAEPISQKAANASGVSFNEAYENFRRKQMVTINIANHSPLYWVTANATKSK